MIVEVKLGRRDVQILRAWYRGTLEESGHYGDSTVIFPDDAIVWRKLDKAEKTNSPIQLTDRNIEIILLWAEEAVANTAINVDEYQLIKKLLGAVGRDIADYSHFSLRG